MFPQAQEQKSFGSFLQKRTFSFVKALISLVFSWTDTKAIGLDAGAKR
jgi:hypothetical protein